jgi:hypothetical protein
MTARPPLHDVPPAVRRARLAGLAFLAGWLVIALSSPASNACSCDGGPVEDAGLGLGDLGALVDA